MLSEHGISHEVLDAAGVSARFPQFELAGDEVACFEPTAGVLFPERCIAVQLRLAAELGATLHLGERVTAIRTAGTRRRNRHRPPHGSCSTRRIDRRRLGGRPAGAALARLARAYRQTLHWFAAGTEADYAPGRFPVFIWMHGSGNEDYFYGFPSLDGGMTIKVASERYAAPVDPDRVDREVMQAEWPRCTRAMSRDGSAGCARPPPAGPPACTR